MVYIHIKYHAITYKKWSGLETNTAVPKENARTES